METDGGRFLEKNIVLGIMSKNTKKLGFFGFCKKKKSPLTCRFFVFESCTIMTFMILLKQYVWEKSGSRVQCKNELEL